MRPVVYLAYGGAESTVFDSQVLTPLKLLRQAGLRIPLIAFQSWKDMILRRDFVAWKRHQTQQSTGLPPQFLLRIPRNIFGLNALKLMSALARLGIQHGPLIIHARGVQSAALAVSLKNRYENLKVILDHRGLEAEEYLYIVEKEMGRKPTTADRRWFERLKALEALAVRKADCIFCVSQALKAELESRYPGVSQKIQVVPCCVKPDQISFGEAERSRVRRNLGLEGRFVLVYAGSLRAWQGASAPVQALKAALEENPASFLLLITPQQDLGRRSLSSSGISPSNWRVLHFSHEQTCGHLCAADIGILTRENHIVNRVASPTKGPEYLAAGNLVLTTPHPQDLSAIVLAENVGAVAASVEDETELRGALRSLMDTLRREPEAARWRARQTAEKYYDWRSYIPLIMETYRSL